MVLERLGHAFTNSEKLQKHTKFLYSKGGLYKKYNSNFISSETADTAPTIDFLTAVNYAMALNGTDGAKINDISLGYYANGDSINISWFVKIENTTYIVDALNGNISIK